MTGSIRRAGGGCEAASLGSTRTSATPSTAAKAANTSRTSVASSSGVNKRVKRTRPSGVIAMSRIISASSTFTPTRAFRTFESAVRMRSCRLGVMDDQSRGDVHGPNLGHALHQMRFNAADEGVRGHVAVWTSPGDAHARDAGFDVEPLELDAAGCRFDAQ